MKVGDLVEIHSGEPVHAPEFSPSVKHSFRKGVIVETNSYNFSQQLVVVVCDSGERLTCYSHHVEVISESR